MILAFQAAKFQSFKKIDQYIILKIEWKERIANFQIQNVNFNLNFDAEVTIYPDFFLILKGFRGLQNVAPVTFYLIIAEMAFFDPRGIIIKQALIHSLLLFTQ